MVNMYKRMLFYFLAYICLWEVPTSHAYSFGGIAVKPELRNRIARPIPLTHTCLLAKKKGSKLISDDLFSSLYDEEGSTANSTPQPVVSKETAFANTVTKDKKKKHKLVSDDLLKSIVSEEANAPRGEQITPSPPPHQQKTVEPTKITEGADSERSVAPAAEVPTKARKDKPSSRIRFVESSQPDFVSLGLDKASVTFGDDVVVKDATFSVSTGERVGLVGPNGAGKSTMLRILGGEIEPTTGSIVQSSSTLRVAYLKQEFAESIVPTRALKDELLSSFTEELQILADIAQCEAALADTVDDADRMDAVLARMQRLQDLAIAKQCYALEPRVQKVMDSMGFTREDGEALVGTFSGGWKMRIGLAKILLLDPNILLLDEPTNHMDLDSVIWLEEFLRRQNLPMLVVSHDREFLDKVCNKIVDVEEGVTVSYSGNYSKYLEQRKARMAQWREKYERQQRYIKEEESYIRRAHGDPALVQVAKSREAALEKLKAGEDFIRPPPRDRKFRFRFPPAPRCGESVIEGSGLGHGYGEGKYKVLFRDVDLQVERGDRIGFIGPNGAGKSTMMRILMKQEDPQKGFCDYGSVNVQANYYAQNQADALDLELTVMETVQQNCPLEVSPTDIRTLLGQFMFKGDEVYKKVRVLSGGEKARVALCKMMLQPANLLFLDEPTNHLDITAKEVLEEALQHYAGAVLLISHDRYFMSQVANSIFAFHDQRVDRHDCDYHDYLERQAQELAEELDAQQQEAEDAADAAIAAAAVAEEVVRTAADGAGHGDTQPIRLDGSTKEGQDRPRRPVPSSAPRTEAVSIKSKVTSRYVPGDKYQITHAKEVLADLSDGNRKDKKKNFGGSGVTCGNLYKGIKNAKRFKDNP